MFHHWMSGDQTDSLCIACGIVVDDGYLFREDPERKIVIGISVQLPDCEPASPSCATHNIGADGTCYHCGVHEPDTTTCAGHETCQSCMDLPHVTLKRNHPSGSVTAWWSDAQGYLQHRQYVLFTDQEIEHDVRESLNPASVTWEVAQ